MTSLLSSLLPFLLIIAVFYFLILRPQQKRQKERAKLLEGVQKGDKIIEAMKLKAEDEAILLKDKAGKKEKAAIDLIISYVINEG